MKPITPIKNSSCLRGQGASAGSFSMARRRKKERKKKERKEKKEEKREKKK